MTYHSTGRVQTKDTIDAAQMAKIMTLTTRSDNRCIYENDGVPVMHNIGAFASGERETIMHVNLKKDGLI